jgi:hypothetical protein
MGGVASVASFGGLRLLVTSPELADALSTIIKRIRGSGQARPSRSSPPTTTTNASATVYPDEAIQAHLAFLARRRAQRPSEEYRTRTTTPVSLGMPVLPCDTAMH